MALEKQIQITQTNNIYHCIHTYKRTYSNPWPPKAFGSEGYRSTDDYYDTFDTFLFYWLDDCDEPIVLCKVGGSGAALFDYARGGPKYGADGLLIGPPLAPVMGGFTGPDTNSGIGDLRMAKSRLGLSYAKRKDEKESICGDESNVSLDDVLVFCSPYIDSL